MFSFGGDKKAVFISVPNSCKITNVFISALFACSKIITRLLEILNLNNSIMMIDFDSFSVTAVCIYTVIPIIKDELNPNA